MRDSISELVAAGDWQAAQDQFNAKEFMRWLGISVDLSDPERPRCSLLEPQPFHLGGIGQDYVNGAVISAVLDIALGLTGIRYAPMGYFATRNLHIDLTLPVENDGFYVTGRETSRIGKNLFAEATVFNLDGEPRVHSTGVVRIGLGKR